MRNIPIKEEAMGHSHHHDHDALLGQDHNPEKAVFAGWAAIGIVAILIFTKVIAYWMSGSVSILSSLIDSFADIMMSVMALISIKMSLKPADKCHRFGHGKIEGLFALVQVAFIFFAGVAVIHEAIGNALNHTPITDQYLASSIIILSLILTYILTRIQKRAIAETQSMAIEADHAHYHSDIAMNLGVLAVLVLTAIGFPTWIDSLYAVGIALYIWYVAYGVGKNAVDMLLDREIEGDVRQQVIDIVLSNSEVRDMHDLRIIRSGMKMLVSFDIEVDANILLWNAHEIALEVERDLLKSFKNSEVMIHVDPAGSPDDARHKKDVHI